MSKINAPKSGGAGGVLLLVCIAGAIAGFLLDRSFNASGAFWIGAGPGGAAVLGVGAAAFCALTGFAARLLLARKQAAAPRKGGSHARADA